MVMIWLGLLIVWTKYVSALFILTLRLSQYRLLIVSPLSVLLPRSVCVNSEAYANPGRLSLHHARFQLLPQLLTTCRL